MRTESLEIIRGNNQVYTLTFSDGIGPIDISEWTVVLTIKERTLDLVLKKEVTVHTDPTNGITQINLTNEDTNIAHGKYLYALTVITGAPETYTVLAGALTIREY